MKKYIFFFLLAVVASYVFVSNDVNKKDSCLGFLENKFSIKTKAELKRIFFPFKQIKSQNEQIKSQNEQIKSQNEQIKSLTRPEHIYNILGKESVIEGLTIAYDYKKKSEYHRLRKLIYKNYILDEEQVTFTESQSLPEKFKSFSSEVNKKSVVVALKYYGITHYGILERATTEIRKLVIYVQGHGGNPYNYPYFLDLKNQLY